MKTTQILIAGFGGQGILFAGKFLAYKGLLEDLQVSWLPSYGQIYVDSTLIDEKVRRADVTAYYIPATQMAKDAGVGTLANMIMMGHVLKNNPELSFEGTEVTVQKMVSAKKPELVGLNMKALEAGRDYAG